MAPVIQLVRRGQPRRAGAHHGNFLPGPLGRAAALHAAGGERVLNHTQLVVPDGHRVAVQPADTRVLTGGGADPPGKFGKVVGFEKAAQGMAPVSGPKHVVPLRNQVVKGAAEDLPFVEHPRLTVRRAAVHAPPALPGADAVGLGKMKFVPVLHPLQGRALRIVLTGIVQESGNFTHM
ncbi:hypothetical protein SDC9_124909 [bioreactor metagenome]|uniref:Uncharacterized protein n=1 Tax=bioreactor metagenome TaxID=1076179 RepID=A0A645CLK5_9ZZZZ